MQHDQRSAGAGAEQCYRPAQLAIATVVSSHRDSRVDLVTQQSGQCVWVSAALLYVVMYLSQLSAVVAVAEMADKLRNSH